jgi:hypothetical protein
LVFAPIFAEKLTASASQQKSAQFSQKSSKTWRPEDRKWGGDRRLQQQPGSPVAHRSLKKS